MGWISLQRQRGLNMAQGGKTGSGEERRGFLTWVFFISVKFCHHFLWLAGLLHTSELSQAGRTGSYGLCPAKDPGLGLSEPALGELDALGLPLAAIQDAWWSCSRLCPGDSISDHLRLLTL